MNEETFNKLVKQVQDRIEALDDKPTITVTHYSQLPAVITHSDDTVRVTVEAEKTCRHCYFWRAQFGYTTRGKCTLDEEEDGPIDVLVYGDCPHEVVIPADWYCKGYQQRGGE